MVCLSQRNAVASAGIAKQADTLEGRYNKDDASNAVASVAKGITHCEKMKISLNRQFQPQVRHLTLLTNDRRYTIASLTVCEVAAVSLQVTTYAETSVQSFSPPRNVPSVTYT